jgi:hypothetical protein
LADAVVGWTDKAVFGENKVIFDQQTIEAWA